MRFSVAIGFLLAFSSTTVQCRPWHLPNGQDIQLNESMRKEEWDAWTSSLGSRFGSAWAHHRTRHHHHHFTSTVKVASASLTSSSSLESATATSTGVVDPTSTASAASSVVSTAASSTSSAVVPSSYEPVSKPSSFSSSTASSTKTSVSSSTRVVPASSFVVSKPASSSSSSHTPSSSSAAATPSSSTPAASTPVYSTFQMSYLAPQNAIRAMKGAPALQWNNTLATAAKQWASNCVFQHSNSVYGENLAAGTGSFGSAAAGIKLWIDEESSYDSSNPQPSHYTQVVWRSSTQIGCAMVTCNDLLGKGSGAANYHVCEYYPAGNVIGRFPANVEA